jgi:predicted amidohydrolase
MVTDDITVALVTEIFTGEDVFDRLAPRLAEARERGARLALLPELPLDHWAPATRAPRMEDAEGPGGPRHAIQAAAAREAGIALVGGAIVVDPGTGRRHNTALVFDERGGLLASYRKLHVPQEEGYWEASHYEPGDEPPSVIPVAGARLGIQICSDANRPELSHLLGALGAELIFVPRATPPESYERWKLVMRANAVTSTVFVLSANRPEDRQGTSIGGPSLAIAPDGRVLLETTDPVAVVTLGRDLLREAREDYPGYLDVRAELYARAWGRLT